MNKQTPLQPPISALSLPKPMVERPTHPEVLFDVLRKAQTMGNVGVVAFDLDATLFTNAPRWVRILQEYGKLRGIEPLLHCQESLIHGWSMYLSMIQHGVDENIAKEQEQEAYAFWEKRFYTSDYCVLDRAIEGAVDYLQTLRSMGTQIAYVTGRHQGMVDGTVLCMKRQHMPVPDGNTVHMLAKPNFEMGDDEWKEEAYAHLRTLGALIAAFDNEPTHINSYSLSFPNAQAVHLLTNDSGRGVLVREEIPSVRNFVLPPRR